VSRAARSARQNTSLSGGASFAVRIVRVRSFVGRYRLALKPIKAVCRTFAGRMHPPGAPFTPSTGLNSDF
jgi:hypothetical protein